MEECEFKNGNRVFEENDISDGVYLMKSGEFEISVNNFMKPHSLMIDKINSKSQQQISNKLSSKMSELCKTDKIRLSILTGNQMFGHEQLMTNSLRLYNINCISGNGGVLFFVPTNDFMNFFQTDAAIKSLSQDIKISINFLHERKLMIENVAKIDTDILRIKNDKLTKDDEQFHKEVKNFIDGIAEKYKKNEDNVQELLKADPQLIEDFCSPTIIESQDFNKNSSMSPQRVKLYKSISNLNKNMFSLANPPSNILIESNQNEPRLIEAKKVFTKLERVITKYKTDMSSSNEIFTLVTKHRLLNKSRNNNTAKILSRALSISCDVTKKFQLETSEDKVGKALKTRFKVSVTSFKKKSKLSNKISAIKMPMPPTKGKFKIFGKKKS